MPGNLHVRFLEGPGPVTAPAYSTALDHRRVRRESGVERRYVLDVAGTLDRVLVETDSAGNPLNYYVYGLGLVSRIDAAEKARHYLFDFRGSTVAMTDSAQVMTHRYAYGPYGEDIAAVEEDRNSFRYVGRLGVQYEIGDFYYMRARYYDAEVGSFLSIDPVWSFNKYRYADGNPMAWVDPAGTCSSPPIDGEISDAGVVLGAGSVEQRALDQGKKKLKKFARGAGALGSIGVAVVNVRISYCKDGLRGAFVTGLKEVVATGAGTACLLPSPFSKAVCVVAASEIAGHLYGVGVEFAADLYASLKVALVAGQGYWIDTVNYFDSQLGVSSPAANDTVNFLEDLVDGMHFYATGSHLPSVLFD